MKYQSDDHNDNYFTRTIIYRLYPNKQAQTRFNHYCDYRRYVWNKFKDLNDHAYQAYLYEKNYYANVGLKVKSKDFCSKYPTLYGLKPIMNSNKKAWEYKYPSKIALMAMTDYDNALSNYKNKALPDWGKPKFRSKCNPRQGFKLPSSSVKTNNKTIILAKGRTDKKHKALILHSRQKFLDYSFGTVSFYTEKGRYYVSVPYYVPKKDLLVNNSSDLRVGIDLNVSHYNFYDGKTYNLNIKLKQLNRHYQRVKHYQRLLAKKRLVSSKNKQSHNYADVRAKLQREYTKINNLQTDFLQKMITKLCQRYHSIVIEDLDVKHMKMGLASKGLHRAMFGKFRQILTYKSEQYNVDLIIADRFYPSTQRCSHCGFVKTGNDKITLWGNKKHHTRHDQYICYNCGAKLDRDDNAATNLYEYPELDWNSNKN